MAEISEASQSFFDPIDGFALKIFSLCSSEYCLTSLHDLEKDRSRSLVLLRLRVCRCLNISKFHFLRNYFVLSGVTLLIDLGNQFRFLLYRMEVTNLIQSCDDRDLQMGVSKFGVLSHLG